MPPFGKATMDGFAPNSTDLAGAGPRQSSCLDPGKDQSRSIRHPA
jgi:molybdopterin biosynthesis enzyme